MDIKSRGHRAQTRTNLTTQQPVYNITLNDGSTARFQMLANTANLTREDIEGFCQVGTVKANRATDRGVVNFRVVYADSGDIERTIFHINNFKNWLKEDSSEELKNEVLATVESLVRQVTVADINEPTTEADIDDVVARMREARLAKA